MSLKMTDCFPRAQTLPNGISQYARARSPCSTGARNSRAEVKPTNQRPVFPSSYPSNGELTWSPFHHHNCSVFNRHRHRHHHRVCHIVDDECGSGDPNYEHYRCGLVSRKIPDYLYRISHQKYHRGHHQRPIGVLAPYLWGHIRNLVKFAAATRRIGFVNLNRTNRVKLSLNPPVLIYLFRPPESGIVRRSRSGYGVSRENGPRFRRR